MPEPCLRNVALGSVERSHIGTEPHTLHLKIQQPVVSRFRFGLLAINKESSFRPFTCLNAVFQREGIMVESECLHSLYLHASSQFLHCSVSVIPEDVTVLVELLTEYVLYLSLVVSHDFDGFQS